MATISLPRIALGWAAVTVIAVVTVGTLADDALRVPAGATLSDLLVTTCSGALVLCAGWAWLVTTVVVVGVLSGRSGPVRGVPAWAVRAVLTACGVVVLAAPNAAGASNPPTHGDGGQRVDAPRLSGLPFPDRPLGRGPRPPSADPAPAAVPHHLVRPGESLWSIAEACLDDNESSAAVAAATRRLYEANRTVVGADPDLIRPGQELRVPLGRHPNR